MSDNDRIRIEIAFDQQVLSVLVPQQAAEELDRALAGGQDSTFTFDADDGAPFPWGEDFDLADASTAEQDLTTYRGEVEECRRFADSLPSLDSEGRGWRGGHDVTVSLRWIYLHMIEEYARHNGHADLVRERVDGSTGV